MSMTPGMSAEDEAHYQASQARWRAKYHYAQKMLPKVTYVKVASEPHRSLKETTYQVFISGKPAGYVGLKRRESWRKTGRIRTSFYGMSKDWWSGPEVNGWQTYSDYGYSRQKATESLLEHLYDLAHPEAEEVAAPSA